MNNDIRPPFTNWEGTVSPRLGKFTYALHAQFQTDMGLICATILGMCASIAQCKFSVKIEDGQNTANSYIQPLSLFTLAFAESSERKSPLFEKVKKPIDELVSEHNRVMQDKRIRQKAEYDTRKIEIKAVRKQIIAQPAGSPKRTKLEAHLVELEKQNVHALEGELRLFLQDTTGSAAADFMKQQITHSMTIADAEGGSLDKILQDRQLLKLLLSAYSAEYVSFERSTKPSIVIEKPHATLCVLTQPAVLQRLAKKTETWEEGLIPRSLIFLAQSFAGTRTPMGISIPSEIEEWWQERLASLFHYPFKKNDQGENELHVLQFSPEAAHAWMFYASQFEQMQAPFNPNAKIKNWLGKMSGVMARVAALYHLFECDGDPVATPISVDCMNTAYNLIYALIPHMLEVHRAYYPDDVEIAYKKIVNWLRGEMGTVQFFSLRDIHRNLSIKKPTSSLACQALVQHQVLTLMLTQESKPGRNGSPAFQVNYGALNMLPFYQ